MKRHFFVPEVIQTSAMDCGPAALKGLFAGFGLYLSYGRLREACQTDVDGTSIDTLEMVGRALGLDVEQRMMPADLVLLATSVCVPAIIVVRLPGGAPHFVVLWRVHGPLVQVMDPAGGRIWMPRRALLESLYIHEQPVGAAAWEEWSHSAAFTAGLDRRMRGLGVDAQQWSDLAHLDASVRLAHALMDAGVLGRGREAQDFLGLCATNPAQIPAEYWTARAVASDPDHVLIRGAVLIAASGRSTDTTSGSLPESLAAVRREPPPRVWAPVWAAVRASGWLLPSAIALALVAAAAGTVFEVVLFRGLFDLARHLTVSGQRAAAFAMVIAFLGGLLALEWPATLGLLRLGRHLELRLRTRFLLKIPRLGDRYFQSRLISDMAFRAHSLQLLRQLPELLGQFVRLAATLLFTGAAIAWLYPGASLPAGLAVLIAIGVPLLFQPALVERDLRVRETSGALSRFYFDALMGSRAIRSHGAERTLRAAHLPQLAQWAYAGLRQQRLLARAEAIQMALALAPIVWLVCGQAGRAHTSAGLLLLIYWALSIPSIGRQLASIVWSMPALRNTMLRFLEPLGAPEDELVEPPAATDARGVKLDIDGVDVISAGHVVLSDVSLHVEPGEHVAIVGSSGAGKSSLVGLLLGWHQPGQRSVLIDNEPLDASRLARLRRDTAWIDPQVHLFRTTLFDNLLYGNGDDAAARVGAAIEDADLIGVLQRLPDGLQSPLGEGGALMSGGEGQRVRIGRALARSNVRLVILDEPARGLDRDQRQRFLGASRKRFAGATLLAITHDVSDTLDFDRVLVIEHGRIIEDGLPRQLSERPGSRYRMLLDAERAVHGDLWAHSRWRRLRMSDGMLSEASPRGPRAARQGPTVPWSDDDAVEEREWTLA